MEISKKELIKLISETEMDEMARKQKGTQSKRYDPTTKQEIIHKFKPIFEPDNNTNYPDYWIVNPSQSEGDDRVVIPSGCDDVETKNFIEQNREWLDKLREKHNLDPIVLSCSKWKEKPRGKYKGYQYKGGMEHEPSGLDTSYKKSGEGLSLKTKLVKKVYNILYDNFGTHRANGQEFNKELNKRSIPGLMLSPDAEHQKFLDRRSLENWSNDRIRFRILGYNAYESSRDFLDCVIARITGKELEKCGNTFHLARQFSQQYTWEEERPSVKTYKGETPKYKLKTQGYSEPDYNVTIQMIFEIVGEKIGENSFNWTIRMTNKFGKKAPDEFRIKGGLKTVTWGDYLDNKPIDVTKTIQLDPRKTYDDENTIMDDIAVSQGLVEAIFDFKEKIKSIDPKSALKIARVSEKDIKKDNP